MPLARTNTTSWTRTSAKATAIAAVATAPMARKTRKIPGARTSAMASARPRRSQYSARIARRLVLRQRPGELGDAADRADDARGVERHQHDLGVLRLAQRVQRLDVFRRDEVVD